MIKPYHIIGSCVTDWGQGSEPYPWQAKFKNWHL